MTRVTGNRRFLYRRGQAVFPSRDTSDLVGEEEADEVEPADTAGGTAGVP
jgi:hypothetical protein